MSINLYYILGAIFLMGSICIIGIAFYLKAKSNVKKIDELSQKEVLEEKKSELTIENEETITVEENSQVVYLENDEEFIKEEYDIDKNSDNEFIKETLVIQKNNEENINFTESESKEEKHNIENNENKHIENFSVEDNLFEKPEAIESRMTRLRSKLANSGTFGKTILNLLSKDNISESDWEEIEDTLLMADLGVDATLKLIDILKEKVRIENTNDFERIRQILHQELLKLVDPSMDRSLKLDNNVDENGVKKSASIIMVGVNGVGKTTTAGKLARVLVAEDKTVLLGAADTFRAAASEQLNTWGKRIGVEVVASDREGADPASVAFEAVKQANQKEIDVVIVDTAGRLQNKKDLLDELGKIKRVMSKETKVNETLLVLDATTGQNGMRQAEVFAQVADITGIVLTKLDGTAKGGIVVSVQKTLGVPVKFVGLGEGIDDLSPFDPETFVKALLS